VSDEPPAPNPSDDPQLQKLVGQLNQAEAALQAYLAAQGTGASGLLRQAQAVHDRRLANILQNVRDSVIVTSLAGIITYWNEGASALFGYTEAEALGQSIELIYPDTARVHNILQQARAGAEFRAELKYLHRDGVPRWVDLRVTPMRDANNQIEGMIGVSKDITESKQAELALQESEARFAAIFQVSPAAISLTSVVGGRFIDVNEAFERVMGYSRAEVIGQTAEALGLWPVGEKRGEVLKLLHERRTIHELALTFRHKNGHLIETLTSLEIIPLLGEEYIVGISQDLTQIKQAQSAIRESEERFQLVAQASNDAVWDWDLVADVVWWNDSFFRLFGYDRAEISTTTESWIEYIHPQERDEVVNNITAAVQANAETWSAEYRFKRKDGSYADIFDRGYVVRNSQGKAIRMLGSMVDISQRKHADAQIRFQAHLLDTVGQSVVAIDSSGKVIYWNSFAERLYGWKKEEMLGRTVFSQVIAVLPDFQRGEILERLQEYDSWSGEYLAPRQDGTTFPAFITISPLYDDNRNRIGTIGVSTDISKLKQAEEAVRRSEARFRALIENSADAIALINIRGFIQYASPATTRILGYSREEFLNLNSLELIHPEDARAAEAAVLKSARIPGHIEWAEYRARHKDGTWHWLNGSVQNLLNEPSVEALIVNYRDVTERKQADLENQQRSHELATIANLSTSLRVAATRSQMLPILLEQITSLLQAAGASLTMPDLNLSEWVVELGAGTMAVATGSRFPYDKGASRVVMDTGQPYLIEDARDDPNLYQIVPVQGHLSLVGVPLVTQQRIVGVLWVGRRTPIRPDEVRLLSAMADIAANAIQRATLHEQTQQNLNQLQALRAIDQVIKSSLDLRLTLTVLLEQIMGQLRVDAVAILLLNRHSQILEYASGRGFRTKEIQNSRVHLGQGRAGRAALQRQIVSDLNLRTSTELSVRSQLFSREDFEVYFGVPLIAKGQVLGVLDIFNRAPLQPTEDWLGFMAALADQAAIAIDNAQLFDNLQRTNLELSMAYNATIEGWSRALDLRDRETEGHSRRVTELTVELARVSGPFSPSEINYIRWGALLHDIGKMGIPDHILLKPGALDDLEWEIMRQHPTHAYELLSPIAYLKLALDIPYCHHEKWDGTGYPRGLKGDFIPLPARLFAVVDVWDALRSDRPYRKAWPEVKVREHLRSLAGTHFDPKAVQAFLDLDTNILVSLTGG